MRLETVAKHLRGWSLEISPDDDGTPVQLTPAELENLRSFLVLAADVAEAGSKRLDLEIELGATLLKAARGSLTTMAIVHGRPTTSKVDREYLTHAIERLEPAIRRSAESRRPAAAAGKVGAR